MPESISEEDRLLEPGSKECVEPPNQIVFDSQPEVDGELGEGENLSKHAVVEKSVEDILKDEVDVLAMAAVGGGDGVDGNSRGCESFGARV